jgi:hypothetical protein
MKTLRTTSFSYQKFRKVLISNFWGLFQDAFLKVQSLRIFLKSKENFSSCGGAVDAVSYQYGGSGIWRKPLQAAVEG